MMSTYTLKITAQPSQRHHFRYLSEGFRAPLRASEVTLEASASLDSLVEIVCQLVQEYKGHDGYFVSPNTLEYIKTDPTSTKKRKMNSSGWKLNFEPVCKRMMTTDKEKRRFTFKFADYCIAKTKDEDLKKNLEKLKRSVTPELVQLPPDDVITQKFGKAETVYLAFTAFTTEGENRRKICETVFSNGILNASESVRILYCFNEQISFEGGSLLHLLLSDVKGDYQIKLCNEEGNWESAAIKPYATCKKLKTNGILAYEVPTYEGPNSSIETAVTCKLTLYDGEERLHETKVRYATKTVRGSAPIHVLSEIERSSTVEEANVEILPPLLSHNSSNNASIGSQPMEVDETVINEFAQLSIQTGSKTQNDIIEQYSNCLSDVGLLLENISVDEDFEGNDVTKPLEKYITYANSVECETYLDAKICERINRYKDDDQKLKQLIEFIYNLLHSNYDRGFIISKKPILLMIRLLDPTRSDLWEGICFLVLLFIQRNEVGCTYLQNELVLRCRNLKIPVPELPIAFKLEKNPTAVQLPMMIHEFFKSSNPEERKEASAVMHNFYAFQNTTVVGFCMGSTDCQPLQWMNFFKTVVFLEQGKIDFALSALKLFLPSINELSAIKDWHLWLRKLLIELFSDNTNIMLRFTAVEFILENASIDVTMHLNVLKEFLMATNNVELHNPNGYLLLINRDIKMGNTIENPSFIEALGSVEWHPVALLYWLDNLSEIRERLPIVPLETFRLLTRSIHRATNFMENLCSKITYVFTKTIDHISLTVFDQLYQSINLSLYNYGVPSNIESKINNSNNEEICNVSKQFCNSLYPEKFLGNLSVPALFPKIEKRLTYLLLEVVENVSKLGWLRFVIPFMVCHNDMYRTDIFRAHLSIWYTKFGLDIELIARCNNLGDVQKYFLSKLNCATQEEKDFVQTKCIEYFVKEKIKEWDDIDKLRVSPEELLQSGSKFVICKLIDLKIIKTQYKNIWSNIHEFFMELKQTSEVEIFGKEVVLTIILEFLTKGKSNAEDIFKISKEFALIMPFNMLWNCLHWIINEGGFTLSMKFFAEIILPYKISEKDWWYRSPLIERLSWKLKNHTKYISALVRLHEQYTKKTPKYCRNSLDHRIKLRIGLFLLYIQVPDNCSDGSQLWEEEWWNLVLSPFDELNAKMLYEIFIAKWVSFNSLMNRLQHLWKQPPNHQLSIITVAYFFCKLTNQVKTEVLPIFKKLWDQITHLTTDIRRFALLVIYTWIERYNMDTFFGCMSPAGLETYDELGEWRQQIKQELGEELEDHLAKEIRLCLFVYPIQINNKISDIFFMTFGAIEEFKIDGKLKFSNEYKKWRAFYEKEARRTLAFPNAEEENFSAISIE